MVSNASEDFPEPLRPVITVRALRGISTSIFFRLCWRAPCTVIRSSIVSCGWEGPISYCGAGCAASANGVITACRSAYLRPMRRTIAADPPHLPGTVLLYGDLRVPRLPRDQQLPAPVQASSG